MKIVPMLVVVFIFTMVTANTHLESIPSLKPYTEAQSLWTIKAPMNNARETPGVIGFGGKLYVFGGTNATGPLSSAEVYDPQHNIWIPLTPLPTAKGIASTAVIKNRIYVLGSDTKVYIYDPFYDTWYRAADIPEAPNGEHGVGVIGDRLYVSMGNQWLYEYDPISNMRTRKNPVPVPRNISIIYLLLPCSNKSSDDHKGVSHSRWDKRITSCAVRDRVFATFSTIP